MKNNYLVPISELGYDPADQKSVIAYAQKLLGKSLNEVLGTEHNLKALRPGMNKGDFGGIIEELYFHIKNNSDAEPDIKESGIEIKTGRFKMVTKHGKTVDQRLKLGSIHYFNSFEAPSLAESVLWKKIEKILLLMYLKNLDNRLNEICDFADILNYPEEDIEQFARDWITIKEYVASGKADELSESLTYYLAACTSAKDSSVFVKAPGIDGSHIKAKPRAFSLKPSYLNELLGLRAKKALTPKFKVPKGQSLEKTVITQLEQYYHKSCAAICDQFKIDPSKMMKAKSRYHLLTKQLTQKILIRITDKSDSDRNEFEQFVKADVKIKTIVLEEDQSLKESMSFPHIDWIKLDEEEDWEESELYRSITKRFLFVVFKKKDDDPLHATLLKAFFWSMPAKDMEKMQGVWEDTRQKVAKDNYEHFLKMTEHPVGHVRPHARRASDLTPAPRGPMQKKLSFWLNKPYIHGIVMKELGRSR